MSRTLYLSIDAGWPHQHPECPWSLTDSGRLLSTGLNAPQLWPVVSELVAVLSPEQLVYHTVKLPPKVNWRDAAVAGMALEDQLVEDLGRVVVTPLRQHHDEVVCCTLQRQRLEQVLAAMQKLGKTLSRVEALTEKLPAVPDAWRIFQNADGHWWLHDGRVVLELDAPAEASEIPIALALRRTQLSQHLPTRLVLHGVAPSLLQGLEQAWGVPVQREPVQDWFAILPTPSTNLLAGDWTPKRKLMAEHSFRKAVVVIAVCACIQILISLASIGRTWWSIHEVKAEQLAFWQEVSGETHKVDKPARQLDQLWRAARVRAGESQPGEFVPVLAALARELPQAQFTSLDYDQGRLLVVWSGNRQAANRLETGMQQRGYTAVTQSVNNGTVITALMAKE